jgi:hypothetical protein
MYAKGPGMIFPDSYTAFMRQITAGMDILTEMELW